MRFVYEEEVCDTCWASQVFPEVTCWTVCRCLEPALCTLRKHTRQKPRFPRELGSHWAFQGVTVVADGAEPVKGMVLALDAERGIGPIVFLGYSIGIGFWLVLNDCVEIQQILQLFLVAAGHRRGVLNMS